MSRIRLSGCILAAIVSICIFSAVYVRRSCLELLDILARVQVHTEQADYAAAAQAAVELNQAWSHAMPRLNMLVSNDELGAEIATNRTLLEQLYYGEIPVLNRLF